MIQSRLRVTLKFSVMCHWPLKKEGLATGTLLEAMKVRTACWRMRLTPKVARRVSSGLLYKCRMTHTSMRAPAEPETRKAKGTARITAASGLPGSARWRSHTE